MRLQDVLRWRPHALLAVAGDTVAGALVWVMRLTGRRIGLALLYHRVDPRQGDPARELVPAHGASLFERHMRHVARHYRPVRASELVPAVRARRRGQRFPVAVTFDDDHPSYVRTTLPILRRHGVTATFFLSGASLDAPFRFWFEQLQDVVDGGLADPTDALGLTGKVPPGPYAPIHRVSETIQRLQPQEREEVVARLRDLAGDDPPDAGMPRSEVEQLAAEPVEIGFHTRRHEPLKTLDDAALAEELRAGRGELEAIAGDRLKAVAYPYGSADARVGAAARAAGFDAGFTTLPEAVEPGSDELLLGRLLPSYRSAGHFALQLARRVVLRA